ncbi:MAG TPA: ABC transporter substrate-binding protein, partial [Chloroflexota bacterium]|nr:ABC transporter substrate-binding protein [Chloroflexota bacterium]
RDKVRAVSGIQVLDPDTIRFTLTEPLAIFPDILAETFNFVVPRAVVGKESADYFASHPIGTGPFMLQSWTRGQQAVFVRNPYYFRPGKPYVDTVIVDVNVPSNVIALRIEKGTLDGFGDASQISAADVQLARGDPRYSSYLVPTPSIYVTWLDLNVHAGPLTQRAVRQAVAMAIDRTRLVQLLGGQAVAANQIYVALDPQYDPSLDQHPIFTYDLRKAAALLKSSGYHGQPVSLLYANNLPYAANMAPGLQQALQQIGLNITLRGATSNSLTSLVGSLSGHQLSIGAWAVSFPDAYDVYSGDLSCGANAAGGISGSHYCDAAADALAQRAESQPLGTTRNALLRQAQRRILQVASTVPLVYLKQVEMVSPQVGGFYYEPIFGWQFENYWLKR